jgi:CO/xanthine dehydrogenase FAD-binding subunit
MTTAHPGLPEFDYVKPGSLAEASKFLADHSSESRPFSGGTDLFVRMRDGVLKQKYLVDIKGLDGTDVLKFDPAIGLTIGAGINMNRIAAHPDVKKVYPLLAEASQSVASYQLRNRATIIGNICNASPAGDSIGACLVYKGVLNVHGVDGIRTEPLSTFFFGPGKTALKPGDIVTSLTLPLPPKNHAGKYLKLGRNKLGDLSIVGVTVMGYPDSNLKSGYQFKIALASVAPVPLFLTKATEILSQKAISEETIAEASQAAMDECKPIDDVRGSGLYRKYMVRNLVKRGVTEGWKTLSK